ncbi:MAG: VWA domain-containing protein [Deltaproteobacteria bacterium]|nr:VWA domain-containing protein [Deltaproteobacteria bacterium]
MLLRISLILIGIVFAKPSPQTLVLAIDLSASSFLADNNKQVPRFIEDLVYSLPEDLFFEIITFDSRVSQLVQANQATTTNKKNIQGILYLLNPSDTDDSFSSLLAYLIDNQPKLVILFTDGFYSDLNNSNDIILDQLRKIRENGTVIIPVTVSDESNLGFLEKVALITQGTTFPLKEHAVLKKNLMGFILKVLYPDLNFLQFNQILIHGDTKPGILFSRDKCDDIQILDPELRLLSREEIQSFSFTNNQICVIKLDRAGTWSYFSNRSIVPLDNLQLVTNIPSKLLEGQVLDAIVAWENNGVKLEYLDLLSISKIELKIFKQKVLGDPVIVKEFAFDPKERVFKAAFTAPSEGDYFFELSGSFPFLTRKIENKILVRGKILDILTKDQLKNVKLPNTKSSVFFRLHQGLALEEIVVDPPGRFELLAKSIGYVAFESPPESLSINGLAIAGREKLKFSYTFPLKKEYLVTSQPPKEIIRYSSLIAGILSSIISAFLVFKFAFTKSSPDFVFDESITIRISNLRLMLASAKEKYADELIAALKRMPKRSESVGSVSLEAFEDTA